MSDRWQKAVVRRRASDTVGGAGPALRRRRMSAKRKQSPILRLPRGEDQAAKRTGWRLRASERDQPASRVQGLEAQLLLRTYPSG